jgi:hypothetical protein
MQETEDPLPKVRKVISDIKNVETNMNVGRNMGNARPLAEFNHSAIPEHFEPDPTRPAGPARAQPASGPPTNLTRRAWAEILKPAKFFLAQARPEMLFLVVFHYKMRGRPAKARARPEPILKIEA